MAQQLIYFITSAEKIPALPLEKKLFNQYDRIMKNYVNKIKKAVLLTGDIVVLWLSLGLTLTIRYGDIFNQQIWRLHFWPFVFIYALWLVIFFIGGLYDLGSARNNWRFYNNLFKTLLGAGVIAAALFYLVPFFGITPKTNLVLNLTIFAILFSLWRNLYNFWAKSSHLFNRVLIVGKTKESEEIVQQVARNPQLGYKIQKFVHLDDVKIVFDLIEVIVKNKINTIVVAVHLHKNPDLIKNLYNCLPLKISLLDIPTFYERITGKIPVSGIEEIWFLENLMNKQRDLYEAFKKVADLLIALTAFLVSLPLYPLIALLIKINSPGPIFYTQKRVGQDGKIFTIYKFRSMVVDAEKNGAVWARKNDCRVTGVGRLLRSTRLDEIPQLLNVLRGDMAFVGPRPERPEFAFNNNVLAKLPFYQIRHLIKPGLTGWAQIKFHYASSEKDTLEKLQYDLYYLKNRSFFLDMAIILRTIKILLIKEGR